MKIHTLLPPLLGLAVAGIALFAGAAQAPPSASEGATLPRAAEAPPAAPAVPAAPASAPARSVEVDPSLPLYSPVSGVTGNLNSIGSDTLNNLLTLWAEGFRQRYPNVNIQVEGKGSSTAPVALIEGTAQLGPMSREMKNSEIDAFERKFGYKPTEIKVAIDALAVFVHKDNPVEGLSLQQVDAIFSSGRKLGAPADIASWGQLGLTGAWVGRPMSLFGRNSASGTYGFFKEVALGKGDFKRNVKEQPGSSSVVQGVAADLGAIGYSGIGYATASVRAVPLSAGPRGEHFAATYENCLSGDYPLARFLYIYVNKRPGQPIDRLTGEFLRFVLSQEGQQIVVKDGYFPMPKTVVDEMLAALN
ncbi:MAG TPA: phosphate ABC transporter substrate-binding protein [Phycisphaerales bacterium]|nr:phosphate ABC transporter substrate-binding protein [Phycisphaerales bacterium]HMP35921.1 phosphate ABC transporter substrate-binding protein [Phycisphaerales bacterium]